MIFKTLKNIGIFILVLAVFAGLFLVSADRAEARRRHSSFYRQYADLVIEADTGRVLRERSGNEFRYPASLTKMMTLYLTFQAIESGRIRLSTRLKVSRKAASQPPSRLGLKPGERITVRDAILALVTKSANDVAIVLAEGLAGNTSRFIYFMNKQARALGMLRTVFRNPNGLPNRRQITTARDMATLGRALIYHYPGFYTYFGRKTFKYRGTTYGNHNHLLKRYRGTDGIKTGYINASGFNLVASAERNGKRLIGVVFGGKKSKTRDVQMMRLLDKTFARLSHEEKSHSRIRGSRLPMPTKVAVAFPSKKQTTAKKVATKKKKTTTPSKPHAWGIQIGAFNDVLGARKVLLKTMRTMKSALGEAKPSLQKITMTDGSTIYRARFVGLNESTAQTLCSHLVKNGKGCLVISDF